LLGMCSYHLRKSSSPFFLISSFQIGSYEQFGCCWHWSTILQESASWITRITAMRQWKRDLFGFFVIKTEQELNNFFVVLGFELRGSSLLSRHCTTWATLTSGAHY
jgi:hypothetical protein